MSGYRDELDDFWDIKSLLPQSKKQYTPTHRTYDAVDIDLPKPQSEGAKTRYNDMTERKSEHLGKIHYVPPHVKDERTYLPIYEYDTDRMLIHNVKISKPDSGYKYFEAFEGEAVEYSKKKGGEDAVFVPFFSFMPQYSQMNARQREYYLFFRDKVRAGEYPEADTAYITLYVFELINVPHTKESAAKAADIMALLWRNYRKKFPMAGGHISSWLCDFCLIYALPAPSLLDASELCELSASTTLGEFYLDPISASADRGEAAKFFLRFCCSYDYTKSKFYTAENKDLFDGTITGAMAHVLPYIMKTQLDSRPVVTLKDSELTRESYNGALVSHKYKVRISVSYTSFSRSHELRFLIGDLVRHIENRLRVWIGVRSKLSVMSLPTEVRDIADAYLLPRTPRVTVSAKKDVPEYERQYDLPHVELSLRGADEIEKSSWETTKILIEAFSDEEIEEVAMPPVPELEQPQINSLLPYLDTFIPMCLASDTVAQRAFAKSHGKLLDAIADEINTAAAESFIGDIILEENDSGGYALIEDYREEISDLIGG